MKQSYIFTAIFFICLKISAQFTTIGTLPPGKTVTFAPFDQEPINTTRYAYEIDESGTVLSSVSAFVPAPVGFPVPQYWALGTIFDFKPAGDKYTGIVNGLPDGFRVWNGSGTLIDSIQLPGTWTLDIHEFTLKDGKYYLLGRRDTVESYGSIRHFAAFVIDSATHSVLWQWDTKSAEGNPAVSPDSSLESGPNKYHFNSFLFQEGMAVISARHQGIYFVDSLTKAVTIHRCGCYQHTASFQGDTLTYFSNNNHTGGPSEIVRFVDTVEVMRWKHPDNVFAPFSGSVVVTNEGFLIGWGGGASADSLPDATFLNRSEFIEWELFIPSMVSYRVHWGKSLPLMRERLHNVRRRLDWWSEWNLLGQEMQ